MSVHRVDCPNVKGMEEERLIPATWDTDGNESYNATIVLTTENKGGLLATITTVISNAKLQIVGVNARIEEKTHTAEMTIVVEIKRASDLEDLVTKLRNIDGVIDIHR